MTNSNRYGEPSWLVLCPRDDVLLCPHALIQAFGVSSAPLRHFSKCVDILRFSFDLQEINHVLLKADAVTGTVATTYVEVAPHDSIHVDDSMSSA
ncbi:hypothetical protein A2U01_0007788 [Trifolium medium]|uniref:Uncharacterized protein n=1 Tax=Trifolium medium TaxID=97028 RepID=A0A392MIL9_9FABA|nr:hypothetical protein [Trifolium medium]